MIHSTVIFFNNIELEFILKVKKKIHKTINLKTLQKI